MIQQSMGLEKPSFSHLFPPPYPGNRNWAWQPKSKVSCGWRNPG